MVGARGAAHGAPIAVAIEQQTHAIGNELSRVADFAFDFSKTLIDSVSKTGVRGHQAACGPQLGQTETAEGRNEYLAERSGPANGANAAAPGNDAQEAE